MATSTISSFLLVIFSVGCGIGGGVVDNGKKPEATSSKNSATPTQAENQGTGGTAPMSDTKPSAPNNEAGKTVSVPTASPTPAAPAVYKEFMVGSLSLKMALPHALWQYAAGVDADAQVSARFATATLSFDLTLPGAAMDCGADPIAAGINASLIYSCTDGSYRIDLPGDDALTATKSSAMSEAELLAILQTLELL